MFIGTIEKIMLYARALADPEEIILFGSMASNTSNKFSDIDLLIICDRIYGTAELNSRIISFASELSIKTDVLIYDRNRFSKEFNEPYSFIASAYASGKIIYKKAGLL